MPDKDWKLDDYGLPPDNDPLWPALQEESRNDASTVSRPEDPHIEEAAQAHDIQSLDRLKDAVKDFIKREYLEDLDWTAFDDLTCIGIAETNAEDREDIIIQMAVNVEDLTLDQYVNGDKMDSWHYSSLDALTNEINHISFDELVSLGPNAEQRVDQLMAQFPTEHDFLRNPEDGFAIYQLKGGPQYHELRFASMDELHTDAEAFRDAVHKAADNLSDVLLDNKNQAEERVRDEGLTVVPNDDPALVTVQDKTGRQASIVLSFGENCCWVDGCDTRQLDEPVRHDNYSLVYTSPFPSECRNQRDPDTLLESLYYKFNMDRPAHFAGHSMSVSDVVALRQNGQVTCYYTDSFGFEKLPNFLSQFEYLRNAEMSTEDDLGMIDGLINNGPKEEPRSFRDVLRDAKEEAEQHIRKPKVQTKDAPEL